MVAVKEFSWEEVSSPDFGARAAWREAVAGIAEKAKAKLPECNGRVDKAAALVLNGDVELLPDGTAKVASQSNGTTTYHVVNGHCDCRDYEKAPHQFCKHRLSAAIARRAQELTKAKLEADTSSHTELPSQPAQPDAPTVPLPEAPVSITLKATLHGHEVMVTLRGVDFASVKAQVEQASEWLRVQEQNLQSSRQNNRPNTQIDRSFLSHGSNLSASNYPGAAQAPAQAPTQSPEHPAGWCSKHGAQMTQNHKDGRSWWSHKTTEGWCKGK